MNEEIQRLRAKVETMRGVILDLSIDTLEHEVRRPALDALRRNRVFTLGQLVKCSPERLRQMRNLGHSAVREIREALHLRGLNLECEPYD